MENLKRIATAEHFSSPDIRQSNSGVRAVYILPPAMIKEPVSSEDLDNLDSEGYTSKIFGCCY
jgi:hypothetical protein